MLKRILRFLGLQPDPEGRARLDLIKALVRGDQDASCRLIQDHPFLLAEQFDDFSGNGRKYHLVHIAAFTGQEALLLALIQSGVDLNVPEPTHKGWTALHFAAQHRHDGVAEMLLENGADASSNDRDGRTALDFALEYDHSEIVERLQ